MLDLNREFRRPIDDPGWIAKVVIGAVFILARQKWFLFPLVLFSYGYLYRVFVNRFRMEEEGRLPEWKEWKDLFLEGLVVFLLALGYYIIPGFFYRVSASILMGGILAKMVGLIFMAGTALLFVAALFFVPMAIAQYVRTEKFSAAFAIQEIWNRIMNIGDDYFKVTLLTILTIVALFILGLIPYAGIFLDALLGFYALLVIASLFGQVCRGAWEELDAAALQPEIK